MTARSHEERALELASLWRSVTAGHVTPAEYLQMTRRVVAEVRDLDALVELVTAQASLTSRALELQVALPDVVLDPDAVLQAIALSEVSS